MYPRTERVLVAAILLTKITAVQNNVSRSYHGVRDRELYFLAVVFLATIVTR